MAYIEFDRSRPFDLVLLGRVAVDFNPVDYFQPLENCVTFKKYVGGSPPNIAVAAARHGMKIMSLAEPTKKMSKSDENENAVVRILDDRDTIIRKFRRAVTDSDAVVRYAEGKDGINNLMTIYAALTGKDMAEIEREFDGRGYGDFKTAVGETCADVLAPVQERFKTYIADKAMLEAQMKKGAAEASYVARRTLSKVQKKLGFVQLH